MDEYDSDISIIDNNGNTFATQRYSDIKPLRTHNSGAFELYRSNLMGKWIVLKALKPEFRNDPFYEAILQKEFNIGYRLKNTHIVETIDFLTLPKLGNVIVLEYIDGIRLDEYLNDNVSISKNEIKHIITSICVAVKYIHSHKLIHRDLKPENIMIERTTGTIKIIDFGCADASDYNIIKGPAGTKHYAAPEQIILNAAIDKRVDIYAIGKIIFHLIHACDNNWNKVNRIALKCCNENKDLRYNNVDEILSALAKTNLFTANIFIIFLLITTVISIIAIFQPNEGKYIPNNEEQELTTPTIKTPITDTVISTPNKIVTIIKHSNREIADSIYNRYAAEIYSKTENRLKAKYQNLEHANDVTILAKYDPTIETLFPDLLKNVRIDLGKYEMSENVQNHINSLNRIYQELKFNYKLNNLRQHTKNLYYNLNDTMGYNQLREFFDLQGYK